jgi:recombination protein RecT
VTTRTEPRNGGADERRLAIVQRTEERVGELLEAGNLRLPPAYAWQNAIRGAWLHLQELRFAFGPKKGELVLANVAQASVANALLDMVIQGLAVHRKQGYFIPYGAALTFQRSYFGSIAVARTVAGLKHAHAEIVYDGDVFEYEIIAGRKHVTRHVQKLDAVRKGEIIAAYAVLEFDEPARDRAEIMVIDEIRRSWGQSRNTRDDRPHVAFPEEMARRTVLNRALKPIVNSATDDYLLLDAFNRDAASSIEDAIDAEATARPELELPVDVDDEDGEDDRLELEVVPPPEEPDGEDEPSVGELADEVEETLEAMVDEDFPAERPARRSRRKSEPSEPAELFPEEAPF